ncbi:hypothetical protein [Archangium lipolyticum]|uniref:hypothetical protein n=1 Tax=Archangium lipolyticum TaxID=2970465 RepID=UPI00214A70B3|nr:hypothetical protein [Archangium lipolyticum]
MAIAAQQSSFTGFFLMIRMVEAGLSLFADANENAPAHQRAIIPQRPPGPAGKALPALQVRHA